jgi:hypothetical protein
MKHSLSHHLPSAPRVIDVKSPFLRRSASIHDSTHRLDDGENVVERGA